MNPNAAWIFHVSHGNTFHPQCSVCLIEHQQRSQQIQNANLVSSVGTSQSTIPNPFNVSTPFPSQTTSPFALTFPTTLPNQPTLQSASTTPSFISSYTLNTNQPAPQQLPYYMGTSAAHTTPTSAVPAAPNTLCAPVPPLCAQVPTPVMPNTSTATSTMSSYNKGTVPGPSAAAIAAVLAAAPTTTTNTETTTTSMAVPAVQTEETTTTTNSCSNTNRTQYVEKQHGDDIKTDKVQFKVPFIPCTFSFNILL